MVYEKQPLKASGENSEFRVQDQDPRIEFSGRRGDSPFRIRLPTPGLTQTRPSLDAKGFDFEMERKYRA